MTNFALPRQCPATGPFHRLVSPWGIYDGANDKWVAEGFATKALASTEKTRMTGKRRDPITNYFRIRTAVLRRDDAAAVASWRARFSQKKPRANAEAEQRP